MFADICDPMQSSWMYRAATAQYLPQELASRYYTDMVDSMRDARIEENTHIVDQDYVLNMGIVHAAVNTFNWEFHAPAQAFIWDWICSGKVDYTNFGRAFAEEAPLLGDTVMAASLAQLYSIRMKVQTSEFLSCLVIAPCGRLYNLHVEFCRLKDDLQ